MPALLPVVLTAMHLATNVGEAPKLNIEPGCRAAAEALKGQGSRDPNACLRDERQARETLEKQWHRFSVAERTRCVQLTTLGGLPSYVELLTCLQIAKDAKNMNAKKKTPGTNGMGVPTEH
ncbi:MAG: hypothetical protein P8Y53_21855 [Pseudolabrys sp.]